MKSSYHVYLKCRKGDTSRGASAEVLLWGRGPNPPLLATLSMKLLRDNKEVPEAPFVWFRSSHTITDKEATPDYVQVRLAANLFSMVISRNINFESLFISDRPEPKEYDGVTAYFQYQGLMFSGESALVVNPQLPHDSIQVAQAIKAIRDHPENANKFVPDTPLPLPEWSHAEDVVAMPLRPNEPYAHRAPFSSALHNLRAGGFPLVINLALNTVNSIGMDSQQQLRYAQLPSFAKFPGLNVDFSNEKVKGFLNDATAGFLRSFASHYNNPALVNFGPALAKLKSPPYIPPNREQREIDLLHHVASTHLAPGTFRHPDFEFGRLFVESVYCTHIHVFQPTDDQNNASIAKWIKELVSPEDLANAERDKLFYVDYSKILTGKPRNTKVGYFVPARCVLKLQRARAVNNAGPEGLLLYPIAISLFRDDQVGPEWTNYLPTTKETWEIAKLFLKCAAAQVHQNVTHALKTHFIAEPFHVALERCLPLEHVVYRLLKPHMRYTLDVNFKARTLLVNQGGKFDAFIATGGPGQGHLQIMREAYMAFDFSALNFQEDLRRRGFKSMPDEAGFELPHYSYATDAKRLFDILHSFVRKVLNATYKDTEAVHKDAPLMRFLQELDLYGFPGVVEPSFQAPTLDWLVRFFTDVIFCASVQHAAVNFPQFVHYSLVANAPLSMKKPPPAPNATKSVDVDYLSYLPTGSHAREQFAVGHGLSRYEAEESFLLRQNREEFYNVTLWNDAKFRPICEQFKSSLMALEDSINQRGSGPYGTAYHWLRPSQIPTSIAV